MNQIDNMLYRRIIRQYPIRQGSSIEDCIRTWRSEDDLLWTRVKVFRTSFYVSTSVERDSYVRLGRNVDATSFLRPRRKRTSGKLSYGPKVGRPLNVRGRLAEWDVKFFLPKYTHYIFPHGNPEMACNHFVFMQTQFKSLSRTYNE